MENMVIRNNQFNIGHICTRQQCDTGLGGKVAMRWLSATMERTDYTFGDLERESNRFANILTTLGFKPGEIFFTFLPKTPEQFFAFLGTLKSRVICGTLFANFGEDALLDRLGDSGAHGIITKRHFLKKIARIRDRLPNLKHIILVDSDEHGDNGVLSYSRLMAEASAVFDVTVTGPETPSVCAGSNLGPYQ